MRYTPLLEFKTLARTQKRAQLLASTPVLRKTTVLKTEDAGPDAIGFDISTITQDLDTDIVFQNWDFSIYRRNPVVCWGHDTNSPPIAKCTSISTVADKTKTRATAEFVPPDVYPFANQIYRMCKKGFISAVSVGFIPIEFEIAKDREGPDPYSPPINFLKSRLLEFSVVTLPACPDALIEPGQREPGTAPLDSAKGAGMTEEQRRELSRKFQRARLLARIM